MHPGIFFGAGHCSRPRFVLSVLFGAGSRGRYVRPSSSPVRTADYIFRRLSVHPSPSPNLPPKGKKPKNQERNSTKGRSPGRGTKTSPTCKQNAVLLAMTTPFPEINPMQTKRWVIVDYTTTCRSIAPAKTPASNVMKSTRY